jgi:hypothetical protein
MTLATPLCKIFNSSLVTGIIPVQLKTAKVIPLFKSGDRDLLDNYRPISLLSVFSKVLEKAVCNRLVVHMELNNILSNSQFGFRGGRSTLQPMILLMNKITQTLEKKEHGVAVFCDLRKAFDSCDHEILLKRIGQIGVGGTELKWFENYLKNRLQYVQIKGENSSNQSIIRGVPQGSVLGPILFLIYINNLPSCTTLSTFLFADDTTLYFSHNDIDVLIETVNMELRKVTDYFRDSKISLHPAKTKFLVFSNNATVKNRNFQLQINFNNMNMNDQTLITEVNPVKSNDDTPAVRFLGVYFDASLNFRYHISLLTTKLSRALFILRSTKNFLTPAALKSVYFSLFHCHLIYCLPIWSSTHQNQISKIYKMQKVAIRIISQAKYNTHTEPLFKKAEILPFPDLIYFFNLQVMHNYINGYLPSQFNTTWTSSEERRRDDFNIVLRNGNVLETPFTRLSMSSLHPYVKMPKSWISFENEEIKILRGKNEFNQKLKTFLLSKLSSVVNCSRMFCPTCSLNNLNENET